jgi:hypothetical protein
MKKLLAIAIFSLAVLFVLMRPICVAVPSGDLRNFNVPIEQRSEERGLIYKVWQYEGGQWYQCKSYMERFFFV